MARFIPLLEIVFGIIALILTAMAFTYLSWAEGLPDARMQLKSREKTRTLFWWAGAFWAATVLSLFLCLAWR